MMLDRILLDHKNNLDCPKQSFFMASMKIYKLHLKNLLSKDLAKLQNRKQKMLGMSENLDIDYQNEANR